MIIQGENEVLEEKPLPVSL